MSTSLDHCFIRDPSSAFQYNTYFITESTNKVKIRQKRKKTPWMTGAILRWVKQWWQINTKSTHRGYRQKLKL